MTRSAQLALSFLDGAIMTQELGAQGRTTGLAAGFVSKPKEIFHANCTQ